MTQRFKNWATFHSHPQSLDSGSTPQAFIDREIELETGYTTATDHGSMGACYSIYELAKKNKLTSILGHEGYFRDDNCPILKSLGVEDPSKYLKYFHFTSHALDQDAYEAMGRILSRVRTERHGSEVKPLFSWVDLEELGTYNVTCGSGCLVGMSQRHLLAFGNEGVPAARAYYEKLRSCFKPGNFYAEMFPHKCDHNWVAGVFITLEDGTKLKYYSKKKLKVDRNPVKAQEEYEAADLAKLFAHKAWDPATCLIGVKHNRTWEERQPSRIVEIKHIEEFIKNECTEFSVNGDVQKACNEVVLGFAREMGDKVVLSDDSHVATPDDKIVQDVRLLQGGGSWRFYTTYNRMDADQAYEYFGQEMNISPVEYESWIANNHEWSERFKAFSLSYQPSLPTKFYPPDTLRHTMELIKKHGRMVNEPKYIERLKAEIDMLSNNGKINFLPYFHLAEDSCSYYTDQGMLLGPGRGSAAGMLMSYLLGITHIDPLEYDLSMTRFLSVDRIKSGSTPDLDLDHSDRDVIVNPETGWLKKRFGDHYAQISTDTTLKLKSSVKDVHRALHGFVSPEVEELTKKFTLPPMGINDRDFIHGYEASGIEVPGSLATDKALIEYVKKFPREWAIVERAIGLRRSAGRHASAYIVANRPVSDFIPLMNISDVSCTQYTAKSVEAVGGIKMDYLSVSALMDVQCAIKFVQERSGLEVPKSMILDRKKVPGLRLLPHKGEFYDIYKLPTDHGVYRDICEGKTETVFQLNTSAARQWLRHFNYWKDEANGIKSLDSIMALAIFTALDRPGPLDADIETPVGTHNMLVEQSRRARGEIGYGTPPIFDQLMPETQGIVVFQEQLEQVYKNLTQCTGMEAEEFRSNVAKKKMDKIHKAYPAFIERAAIQLGSKEAAESVWAGLVTFGQYAFGKSHSVSYVTTSYACAFLKHHYPLEWWTAVLRNATKNEINANFWRYCGHLVDLPDISLSQSHFAIVNERIRAPLSVLQGVGEKASEQLIAGAPYNDIQDFCNKIEKYCTENAKPVLKDGQPVFIEKGPKKAKVTVQKIRRATTALNQGVCYKLIVSGSLDSLFPAGTHIIDKLMEYEKATAIAKGKKKPESVDPGYLDLNAVKRFQIIKGILPMYAQELMPLIETLNIPGVSRNVSKGRTYYTDKQGEPITFVNLKALETLEMVNPWPEGQRIQVAMPVYILAQRVFSYKGGKQACELELDIDGERLKLVKWPGKDGVLPSTYQADLKGSIAIAILSKWTDTRPFGLEYLEVVAKGLPKKAAKDEADE